MLQNVIFDTLMLNVVLVGYVDCTPNSYHGFRFSIVLHFCIE